MNRYFIVISLSFLFMAAGCGEEAPLPIWFTLSPNNIETVVGKDTEITIELSEPAREKIYVDITNTQTEYLEFAASSIRFLPGDKTETVRVSALKVTDKEGVSALFELCLHLENGTKDCQRNATWTAIIKEEES